MVIIRRKRFKYIGVVLILAFVMAVLSGCNKAAGDDEGAQGEDNLVQYVRCIVESEDVEKVLADSGVTETPYIWLYRDSTLAKLTGQEWEQAVDTAITSYLRLEAVSHEARQQDLYPDEQEVDAYIGQLTDASKDADNYDTLSKICAEQGTTFEETYYMDRETYLYQLCSDRLFERFCEENELSSDLVKAQEQWEAYCADLTEEFLAGEEGQAAARAAEECRPVLLSENNMDAAYILSELAG